MARPAHAPETVVVIGLGRFGGAVAHTLTDLGHEVLALEESLDLVQTWSDRLTHVVQADGRQAETLRRLGVHEARHAVVGIGNDIEASVLTVLALSEVGVPAIWAKAVSANHGKILQRTGAHHVIYPEVAMGERVAHRVTSGILEVMDCAEDAAVILTRPPREAIGRSLAQSRLGQRDGVQVLGLQRPGAPIGPARPDDIIQAEDRLVVSGTMRQVARFAARR